jgi:indole-3-glycerol phosphate synthase
MQPALTSILAATREQVGQLHRRRAELLRAAESAPPRAALAPALQGEDIAVIAEVKRRSPSAGAIAETLDPVVHARAYVAGGARAVSVLTEPRHFGGSLADLEAVASRVDVPLLRKDFVIDEIQLAEARLHGASAVLLIVRALDRVALRDLRGTARSLGLACLVEVHSLGELDRALDVAPEMIGVNARDLETFRVNLGAIEPVLRAIPPGTVAVAESGLVSRADVEAVAAWGADAVLVGTAVAAAPDPASAVRALVGVGRMGRGRARKRVIG